MPDRPFIGRRAILNERIDFFMLNQTETDEVKYILSYLSPTPRDCENFDYLDKEIVNFSLDEKYARDSRHSIKLEILELKQQLVDDFTSNCGITPRGLALQERLYQLRLLLDGLDKVNNTRNLAMLCVASSFDFAWLPPKESPDDENEEKMQF